MGFVKDPHENYALEVLYTYVKDRAYLTHNERAEAVQAYTYLKDRIANLQMFELKHAKDVERKKIARDTALKDATSDAQPSPSSQPTQQTQDQEPVVEQDTPPVEPASGAQTLEEIAPPPLLPAPPVMLAPPTPTKEQVMARMQQLKADQDRIKLDAAQRSSTAQDQTQPAPPKRS